MKKIIITFIIIVVIVLLTLFFLERNKEERINEDFLTQEQAEEIAQDWIINNSPTYLFDGRNLSLLEIEEVKENEIYKLIFSFESSMAGYGNRSDEIVAQVITSHEIEVVVDNQEVIGAVTDTIYDEINQTFISQDTRVVKLYFLETIDNQEKIVEVERGILAVPGIARATIEELLKGPSKEEKEKGISTAINQEVKLNSIDIQDGVAKVDFNEKLQEGIAGSALVLAIREQIEKTLLQFDIVDEVIIMINGETEEILQP